jgi:hypothetical protein
MVSGQPAPGGFTGLPHDGKYDQDSGERDERYHEHAEFPVGHEVKAKTGFGSSQEIVDAPPGILEVVWRHEDIR